MNTLLNNLLKITGSGLVAGFIVVAGSFLFDRGQEIAELESRLSKLQSELDRMDNLIEVHELTFDPETGLITQDRTVHAGAPVTARWQAIIREERSGRKMCEGNGWWDYPRGRKTPKIPLDIWAGDQGCARRLQSGKGYQPCAVYRWADGRTEEKCGLLFFVKP